LEGVINVKKTFVGVVLGLTTIVALRRFGPSLKAQLAKFHDMMAKCRAMFSATEQADGSPQILEKRVA
jgi:hypothetical protein